MGMFWTLLRESVIIQGVIALIVVGAVVGRLFQAGEVDPELWAITGTVVGFYFGSKVTKAATNERRNGGG